MKDEEFEKYFERIDCIFDSWFVSTPQERKDKLKQILEEIEKETRYKIAREMAKPGRRLESMHYIVGSVQ
ncbi:MAG TPA: hypothetical protein PLP73_04810, partial [Candidatus Absconditabacterales bacterium]|nr:hypothetical protein [Candidatus Absconditabacterales bacterium]